MQIKKESWGVSREGVEALRYILRNDKGMEVELSDFGALILAIRLPAQGGVRDVALGFDTLEEYYDNGAGFGAYIGRNANRIADALVTLEGVRYELEPNDNGNNLHSGSNRSCCVMYAADCGEDADCAWVEFSRLSPHMEQGFPGDLTQKIRYTLTNANELMIGYSMVSDKTTVINPTNHSYFNLDGHSAGSVNEHTLTIYSDAFLPTNDKLIPTGELRSVEGTPLDFRSPKKVGLGIDSDYGPIRQAGGYDHNYCFADDGVLKETACIESSDGTVSMTVATDLCGMQLYSGNFLMGIKGKEGAVYNRRAGICFESQFYPNACNDERFPGGVTPAGEVFKSTTVYRFAWK